MVAAGKLAVRLINHLVEANPTFDFVGELESLVLLAERAAFGPSTQAILDEATRRDIPYIRLNDQSFVQRRAISRLFLAAGTAFAPR